MTRRILTVFALVLLLPWRGTAQEQGGALDGAVRDAQGGPLPGVVVVARSAAGLGVEAVSDAFGVYRLSALPSGSYELSASLSGFLPVRVVGIELALGVRLTVDLVFHPAGPNEFVEVVATPPSLARTQVMRATSITGPLIDKMPHGRDFTSLALQAPGAANERKLAGISVDGASGAENRIIIDGVETTDTWVGTPGQAVITDFIEELQVKSSGYSAEFGGSTGAVLNAVTKSGGSRWQGLGVLYWSGSALDAAPRETLRLRPDDASRAEYVTYPEDHYTQIEPGFTVGGPLLADRLWLFGGYLPSFRPLERTVRANQSTRTVTQDLTRQNGLVNVTARLSERWRAKASFVTAWEKQRNLLPAQDGTSDPNANFGIDDVTPNYSTSASVDYTPAGWAYLSFRGGYFDRDSYNEGVYQGDRFVYLTPSLGLPGVPPQYQQPRLYMNVPSNVARDRAGGRVLGFRSMAARPCGRQARTS